MVCSFFRSYCQRIHSGQALSVEEFARLYTLITLIKRKLPAKKKGEQVKKHKLIADHPLSWYRDEWCHFLAKAWASVFSGTSASDPYDLLPSETRNIKKYHPKFKMTLCNYCADVLFPKLVRNHLFFGIQRIEPPVGSPTDFRPLDLPTNYGKLFFIFLIFIPCLIIGYYDNRHHRNY